VPVLGTDADILKGYYRLGMNSSPDVIYNELTTKVKMLQEALPLEVNKKVVDLLELGAHYIAGRDK
jgi:hypothetical protein